MAAEQKVKKIPKGNSSDLDYDDIDLFDLFRKIWKWKWLIMAIVIIFCVTTFFYVKTRPLTYTSESTVRIGEIANVLIEQGPDIQAYLQSNVFQENEVCSALLNSSVIDKIFIKIKSTSDSPDISFTCLDKAIKNLLDRHNIIYKKALKKITDNITSIKTKMIIDPVYVLDTYTFPSSLVSKPEKPVNPDSKKLTVKMAVSFFSSLFLGIFLSFFIEYIISRSRND